MRTLDLLHFIPKCIFTKKGKKIILNRAVEGAEIIVSRHKPKHRDYYKVKSVVVPKNKILLWYKWKCGSNQNSKLNNGIRFNHLLLPRFLRLDKLTLAALGLLQAEMTKSKKISCVIFANSEPILINKIFNFFKRFELNKDAWKWDITFNFKLLREENKLETETREGKSLDFWIDECGLNPENKHLKVFNYTGNKNYENMKKDTVWTGSLRIMNSNILLYQYIKNLILAIRPIVEDQRQLASPYLSGIFAGEGYVKFTPTGSVDSVQMGCTNDKEKTHYQKCLSTLGITSKIEENGIRIFNLSNFVELFKFGVISLHPKRYERFIRGMSLYRRNYERKADILQLC